MIKFKEHDGMLFKILDKPVPLTPDAEMPCIIAPIQDDSPIGKYVKQCWGHDKLFMREYTICDIKEDMAVKVGFVRNTPLSIHMFEIIGLPVEEGSRWWALYQMMQGKKVTKRHLSHIYWQYDARPHLQCISEYNCGTLQIMVSPEIWLITAEPTGWQLYKEPEPQYKVGDWVEVSGRGRTIHGKCISTEGTVSEPNNMIRACGYLFNPDGTDARYRCKTHGYIITRKLSPSEVIVNIGRLSGTVEPVSNNGIHLWFHLVGINRKTIATISIESLDTNTRELVESLLEAMQEG